MRDFTMVGPLCYPPIIIKDLLTTFNNIVHDTGPS
jgi:hypothetical protein